MRGGGRGVFFLDFQGPPVSIEAGIPNQGSIPLALAWLRSKRRSPRVGLGPHIAVLRFPTESLQLGWHFMPAYIALLQLASW